MVVFSAYYEESAGFIVSIRGIRLWVGGRDLRL